MLKSILCIIFILVITFNIYPSDKGISIIFRYDDYSDFYSYDVETKIIDIFKENSVPITIGVIPFKCASNGIMPLSEKKIDYLRSASLSAHIEIALHGYCHKNNNNKINSEFIGVDYNRQLLQIERGKRLLEQKLSLVISTFIPPWNSFDNNTIMALTKNDFKIISANEDDQLNDYSTIKNIPYTVHLLDLKEAVLSARMKMSSKQLLIALIHPFDFFEVAGKYGKITYRDMNGLLKWIQSEKYVTVTSFAKVNYSRTTTNLFFYKSSFGPLSLHRFSPHIFNKIFSKKILYQQVKIKGWICLVLFYTGIFIISFFTTLPLRIKYIASIFTKSKNIVKYIIIILECILLVYIFHDLQITFYGVLSVTFLLGFNFGLLFNFFKFIQTHTAQP